MKTKLFNFLSSFLLVFAFGFSVQAQSISGTVTDENGVPLPGATVLVEGTQMEFQLISMVIIQLTLQVGTPLFLALLDILINQ